jgi:Tfp pilus assembly protein PilN
MKFLYVELKEDELIIGLFKKTAISSVQHVEYDRGEISGGGMYNISTIFKHVMAYIKNARTSYFRGIPFDLSLSKGFTERTLKDVVVSVPFIKNFSEKKRQLFVLQVSLCMSKIGLNISKIISDSLLSGSLLHEEGNVGIFKKELKNKLDFFDEFRPPKQKQPYTWLCVSGAFFVVFLATFICIEKKGTARLKLFQQKSNELVQEETTLVAKTKEIHSQQKEVASLAKKNKKCVQRRENLEKYQSLLVALAETIPEHTVVNTIKVSSKSKKKGAQTYKYQQIEIDGTAFDNKEVVTFCQSLSNARGIKKVKIERLSASGRYSDESQHKTYSACNFKFTGRLS